MNKTALRLFFGFIFLSLLAYTSFASTQQPVWEWQGLTLGDDRWWTIATLIDAYYAFLTFYAWVLYKERRALPRVLWFVGIMLLGNMAMAAYVLLQVQRLPAEASTADLLTTRNG